MEIDKEKLNKCGWFEDAKTGKVVSNSEAKRLPKLFYNSADPLVFTRNVSEYCWHPNTFIQKLICKIPMVHKYLMYKNRNNKTFKHLCSFYSTFNEKLVLAMANSGDYTLKEAIVLCSTCCQRCLKVLLYEYLGDDGYEEYSDEWQKCNTHCEFCSGRIWKKGYVDDSKVTCEE